jgi:hypothetical protein
VRLNIPWCSPPYPYSVPDVVDDWGGDSAGLYRAFRQDPVDSTAIVKKGFIGNEIESLALIDQIERRLDHSEIVAEMGRSRGLDAGQYYFFHHGRSGVASSGDWTAG